MKARNFGAAQLAEWPGASLSVSSLREMGLRGLALTGLPRGIGDVQLAQTPGPGHLALSPAQPLSLLPAQQGPEPWQVRPPVSELSVL